MLLYWIVVSVLWVFIHIVWRIEVIGRENLEAARKQGSWVVAGNHISNIDPVFIVVCIYDLSRMRVLAKAELFKNAFLDWFFRCMGAVAIDRGKGDTTLIDRVTEECRNGKGVMIFPEGTRSKDGRLGNLKSGAFVIASSAGAAVVPCRIIYDTPDGRAKAFCKVRICFGPAIPASELQITDPTHKIAALRRMKKRLSTELEALAEEHYFPAPAFDPRQSAALAAKAAAPALEADVVSAPATPPEQPEQPAAQPEQAPAELTIPAITLESPHLEVAAPAPKAAPAPEKTQ